MGKASDHKEEPVDLKLLKAAKEGDTGAIRDLLNAGLVVNTTDQDGNTPLHLAAAWGKPEAAELLLDNKANIEAQDNKRRTPLHRAAAQGQLEAVRLLLDRQAKIEAPDEDGRTPLHHAVVWRQLETVELLLKNKADVEAQDNKGRIPLHLVAKWGKVGDKEHDLLWTLIPQNTDATIEARDNEGRTPLHLATECEDQYVIRFLLDKGAKIEAQDNKGRTPLHLAAKWGKLDAVKWLLNKGANIEATDNLGRTPLHLAAKLGRLEAVTLLLDRDANVNATDNLGRTPLHLAAERKYSDCDYQKTINLLNPYSKKKIAALAVSGILITSLGVTLCITTGAGVEIAGVGIAYIKAALITAGALQLIESLAKWRAWFAITSPRFAQAGKFIQIVAAAALIAVGIGIMVSTWGAGSLVSLGLFSMATEILGALLITAGATSAVSALWHNVTNSTLWHNVKTKSIACCSSQPQETVSLPAPS